MQFLSDEWLTALDVAARDHSTAPDDPLADVTLTIEQAVVDGPSWRFIIDRGSLSIERGPGPQTPPDGSVRLTSDRDTATDIAAGRRAALDAFITGDLVIGGDVRAMLEHRAALETLGELFAGIRSATTFPPTT